MTARNYDIILTVPSTTGFISGNIIVGSTSATSGFIANVDSTAKQLKVKLNNVLQEFHTSETITSISSVVGGSRINTTVFTPILTLNSIGAADSDRTAGTYNSVQGTGGPVKNISGATQANPVVVTTTTGHNLRDGSKIVIASVSGMTELNTNTYYSKRVSDTRFQLYSDAALTTTVNGTGFTAYTSGGTVTGGGASFNIIVNGSGAATVTVSQGGQNYVIGETITIADADLGGGGAAALTFNVATTGGFSGTQFPTAITDITRANPGVVTIIEHGFTTGDRYYFTDVEGMTEVNGNIYTITVIDEDTFSIVNTTAFTAYSGTTGFVTFITTLTVADTSGIEPGYTINSPNGKGYTGTQTVTAVPSSTTLTISAPPNTIPSGELIFVDISSTLKSVPFTSNIFVSSETTASTTISSQVPSPFISEKNAFTQNPITRLYDIYYPGEWFPPDRHGNPTGEGTGRSWPTNFPLKFADIAGDLVSDLSYNVTYDGESYIPFPIDITSIKQNQDGKIDDLTLTVFNVDNIVSTLVEDPFIVGNNITWSCVANVNGVPVNGIDPRTVEALPADVGIEGEIAFDTLTRARANGFIYSEDIVGIYGKSNASWNYQQTITSPATDGTKGVWQIQKNDSRDIQGGVVKIKTTFANFLDVWPEHSSIKYITSNVVEVYNAMPYRVGDIVKSSKGPSTATIESIQENRFLFLSDVLEHNTSIGDDVFIINADVDTDSYVEDVFKIDHLEELGSDTASFGLVTWLQYFKQVTPRRKYYKNTCQWQYKGEECQYPGPAGGTIPGTSLSANTNPITADNTTASGPEGDICGKNILACTLRNNGIHFGGFPATGRTIPKQ